MSFELFDYSASTGSEGTSVISISNPEASSNTLETAASGKTRIGLSSRKRDDGVTTFATSEVCDAGVTKMRRPAVQ